MEIIGPNKETEVIYESELNPEFDVVILFPESTKYVYASEIFSDRGDAFILQEQKSIVVNGDIVDEPWFTDEHLLMLQARELGHYFANGAKPLPYRKSLKKAREGDWLGHAILKKCGCANAATLHENEYYERYGVLPEVHEDFMKIKFEDVFKKL